MKCMYYEATNEHFYIIKKNIHKGLWRVSMSNIELAIENSIEL